MTAPICLFTDFGSGDIYVGQAKAVLASAAPESAVIDVFNDAPNYAIEAGAHLLAALAARLPVGAVTIAVVDPGVGTARGAAVVEADGRWYVGPDNGLLSVLAARSAAARVYALPEVAGAVSVSFHGRDVFAPIAARIARGDLGPHNLERRGALAVALPSGDLRAVIYIDHYGNAMTGIRAASIDARGQFVANGTAIEPARVFGDVPRGQLFWYANSIGLVELAANQENAARLLGARIGETVCPR